MLSKKVYWPTVLLKATLQARPKIQKRMKTYIKCNADYVTVSRFLSRAFQFSYAFITEVPVR